MSQKKPIPVKHGNVTINEKWCKRCGICVEFCPEKVFEQHEISRPVPAKLENCRVCRMCEVYCPEFAITVDEMEESE